jgi:3-isopropylmalate dehydratase small subunit
VAQSAINGTITVPGPESKKTFAFSIAQSDIVAIPADDNRYDNGVWNYQDINNLNTDQMFAGNLTYEINSSQPEKIVPHLFKDFDERFAQRVQKGDIIICGENFGCGSSREHPAVGLVYAGIKAVIVRSVSRIFFRAAVNQGLPILLIPEAVEAYKQGDPIDIDMEAGLITIAGKKFAFSPLPEKLRMILRAGGLLNAMTNH